MAKKPGLYANINARKKKGISRSKKKSTIQIEIGSEQSVDLNDGEMCDAIISAMTKTDERDQVVDFTRGYYTSSQGVIGAAGSASISDVSELNAAGTTIAVQSGTTSDLYAQDNLAMATIVAYDDLDLAAGKIRLKFSGGSGGHNGIKDIIEKIGTKDFWRLKIGIGKPTHKDDVISYVLGKPSPDDKKQILKGIENIIQNSQHLLDGSYTNFMNNLNGDNNGV